VKELQERAAALTSQDKQTSTEEPTNADEQTGRETGVASASAHFGASVEHLTYNREIYRMPVKEIAPDVQEDSRQLRFLPLPEEMIYDGHPLPMYRELVAELLVLGDSLQEGQIQPVVVYPGTSEVYKEAKYLLLVGHRRWTAARLVGMEFIDAIIVDRPDPADRAIIQYTENEARSDFCDMERAWTIREIKRVMGKATWDVIEERLQMSRSRRQQLYRMLSFSPEQQRRIALLRAQETQIRPLHSAFRSGEFTSEHVDIVLKRLNDIAERRLESARQAQMSEMEEENPKTHVMTIDSATVARVVAKVRREIARKNNTVVKTPTWFPTVRNNVQRTRRSLRRTSNHISLLNEEDRKVLQDDIKQLQQFLRDMMKRLEKENQKKQHAEESEMEEDFIVKEQNENDTANETDETDEMNEGKEDHKNSNEEEEE
jgi:ParB/RepB/Spo0J family partition protein